jgi:hypothetical protein
MTDIIITLATHPKNQKCDFIRFTPSILVDAYQGSERTYCLHSGRLIPTLRRYILPVFWAEVTLFYPEDGETIFLRNAGFHLSDYRKSYFRRTLYESLL